MAVARRSSADEGVKELSRKIAENNGEVALVFRKIYIGTIGSEGFIPPRPNYDSHFEAGVIRGNLERREEGNINIIDLHALFHRPHSYIFFGNLLIPVNRKLSMNPLNASASVLSKAGEGYLEVAETEIAQASFFGFTKEPPRLDDFGVFIGDAEIKDFMRGPRFEHYAGKLEERVSDFLYLMKNPVELARRTEKEYFDQRENLAENLVARVANLALVYRNVSQIEAQVLRLRLSAGREGKDMSYIESWSDPLLFDAYSQLRSRINSELNEIDLLLQKAKDIDMETHPSINGAVLGFPSGINPRDYLTNLSGKFLPSVQSTIKGLDDYLKKARKAIA